MGHVLPSEKFTTIAYTVFMVQFWSNLDLSFPENFWLETFTFFVTVSYWHLK